MSTRQDISLHGACSPSVTQILRERVRRFQDGQGGGEGHFSFRLPSDADLLACFYSRVLRTELIEQPLQRFLLEAVKVPDMQAIALAVWREVDMPYDLSVYALGNLGWQQQSDPADGDKVPEVSRGRELYLSVNRAYSPLHAEVQTNIPHISCSLWFINTEGNDIRGILPGIEANMTNDEFGFHSAEDLVYYYDAVIDTKHLSAMPSDRTF
ncbi:MAG TPA: hypothetical protein VGE04_04700 [Chloroflexia bacterium]